MQKTSMQNKKAVANYASLLREFVQDHLSAHPVYQNNQIATCVQALNTHFPMLASELGEEIFGSLCQVYTQYYPSVSWDINLYGEAFSELISAQQNSPRADLLDWCRAAWVAGLEYRLLAFYYEDSNYEESNKSVVTHEVPLSNCIEPAELFSLLGNIQKYHPWISYQYAIVNQDDPQLMKLILRREISDRGFTATIGLCRAYLRKK